jgi:Uma2 family endonuclease
MTRQTPLTTADAARNAPPDGPMIEVVSTELVTRETPSPAHDAAVERLHALLSAHADKTDLGAVFRAPWPVELSRYDLVRPDICFVGWDREGVMRIDGIVGPPDLIVEVVSPESRQRDEGEKKRLYNWARVLEYWLVDPEQRVIQAFTRTSRGYQPIPDVGGRFGSVVITGFELDTASLFRDEP